jgi:hypothetical protein
MAIRNKCYNTCCYLHDRFSIQKLFLVRNGTLRILSWWADPGSECQIWKTLLWIRPTKNICLFTVTRPTLFSAATLVHFIGKSKVKVDTSEIVGLKKLFPVTSWKIIGINFFIIRPQQFFWSIIAPSDRRAIKYILKSGTFSGYG